MAERIKQQSELPRAANAAAELRPDAEFLQHAAKLAKSLKHANVGDAEPPKHGQCGQHALEPSAEHAEVCRPPEHADDAEYARTDPEYAKCEHAEYAELESVQLQQ
jgi:hypothetical protein